MDNNKPSFDYLGITLGILAFIATCWGLLYPEIVKYRDSKYYNFSNTKRAFK